MPLIHVISYTFKAWHQCHPSARPPASATNT